MGDWEDHSGTGDWVIGRIEDWVIGRITVVQETG